jgi:adenylylsulfate kinase
VDKVPLHVLVERDTKGYYRKALLPDQHPDKLYHFTGVNDPYDIPLHSDLVIEIYFKISTIAFSLFFQPRDTA